MTKSTGPWGNIACLMRNFGGDLLHAVFGRFAEWTLVELNLELFTRWNSLPKCDWPPKYGPCAPNDCWIFDPFDPQSFVRSMACHFHTAFCHACEGCVHVFCRRYLNVGDILTESGHILADLWKNWCYGCLCRFLFNHFNPLTSSNIFSPGRVQEGSTATLKGFQNILYMFIFFPLMAT